MSTKDKFQVEIELGNAAMDSASDIADALADIANKVAEGNFDGPIIDLNGNSVGFYRTLVDSPART